MRTGPSLQRNGPVKVSIPRPTPRTEPKTFAFVKIDHRSCNPLVLANHLLHRLYIQAAATNTLISSANAETLAIRGPAKGTQRTAGLTIHPYAYGAGAPKRGHRKGEKGGSPAGSNARSPTPSNAFVHLQDSAWNPAVSKTVAKNQWSILSKVSD